MINPHNLEAKYKRWNDWEFPGGKVYLPMLTGSGYAKSAHKTFRRASEAEAYARSLLKRWVRLYDAVKP